MSRFSQIQQFNITERTSFVEMPELGPGAKIEVKSTADTNKPYYNAMLRIGTQRNREVASKKDVEVEDIIRDRKDASSLFPKYVMVSFVNVPDGEGTMLEYSEKLGEELIKELVQTAPHLFDRIRDHAGVVSNFYQEIVGDAEKLAENSLSDSSGS